MDCIQTSYNAPNVTRAFQFLYRSHRYTDFIFISQDGNEQYSVHKLVVSMFSPVLSSIVKNNDRYYVDTVNNTALQNMVRFFYDENPIINDIHDVRSTKTIADKFEIVKLAEICRERFSKLPVTLNDVLTILETSRELKDNAKERECIELIGKNRDVLKSEQFKKLQYQRAIDILEKIKDMQLITEANFLEYTIEWLETNGMVEKKSDLKEKINLSDILLKDFLSLVVLFPKFFSNVEISETVKEIQLKQVPVKHESKFANNSGQSKDGTASAGRNASNSKQFGKAATSTETNANDSCFNNVGTSIEKSLLTHCTKEVGTDVEKSLLINVSKEVGTSTDVLCNISTAVNTDVQGDLTAVQKSSASDHKDQEPAKQKLLTVQILNEEDGVNVYNLSKRVKFTIKDGISTRSLQVKFDDVLKKGLLGKVLEKRQFYQVSDVNVSYEGIFNMMRLLKDDDDDDLKPTELIEVLNAVEHFELAELRDKCILKISKIVDIDPLFLDGLRTFSFFEDQCLAILLQEPFNVILHPNFIHCSAGLIHLLLKQSELKVKNESQLLLVVISWLEASVKEKRDQFRSLLLKNLAFESISTKDFKYVVSCHPNFFAKEEKEIILAYRNAIGEEERKFRNKLPPWYTFKSRTLI